MHWRPYGQMLKLHHINNNIRINDGERHQEGRKRYK